jgi:hypothetical protein
LDCSGIKPEVGCTQRELIKRIDRVLASHTDTIASLRKFATSGRNRLIIIPGNHDAALTVPAVSDRVKARLALAPDRLRIEERGYWMSEDGQVFSEHGHQFDKVNRFASWPLPYHMANGEITMERPWGEQMVQQFFNSYEYQYPIIDNLAAEADGVRYGLATLSAKNAAIGAMDFFRFLLLQTTFSQKGSFLSSDAASVEPEWDLQKVQATADADFLLGSIDRSDPAYPVLKHAIESKPLALTDLKLTAEDYQELCDRRLILRDKYAAQTPPLTLDLCPRRNGQPSMGYVLDKLLGREQRNLKQHLLAMRATINAPRREAEPFSIFVFGHTHSATPGQFIDATGVWRPFIINTGAFQRVIDSTHLRAFANQHQLDDDKVLDRITLEDLPRCYTFVRVAPADSSGKRSALLRYWAEVGTGFAENDRCPSK